MVTINANTDALSAFARKLRRAYPEVDKALKEKVRDAGKLVAGDAKARYGAWSTSIPPTVKSSARANVVTVKAGKAKPPSAHQKKPFSLAVAYDRPSGFRHRVFGDPNVWRPQTGAPKRSLREALDAQSEPAKKLVVAAVLEAIDRVVGGEA